MIETTGLVFTSIGVFFLLVGSLGVLRFEDVYLRLQASSKSLTFGFGFLMLGVGILSRDWEVFGKAILAVLFQVLTAPIAAQMIARAGMRRGLVPKKLASVLRRRDSGEDSGRDQAPRLDGEKD